MKRLTIVKQLTIALILMLLVALLTACGASGPETAEEAGGGENPVSATGSERAGDEPPAPPVDGSKVEATRVTTETVVEMEESFAGEADTALAAAPMATAAPAAEMSDRAEAATGTGLTLDQNSRLTAGEVDDNAQWDDYLLFLRDYSGAYVERVDVSGRHQIWVQDSQEQPIVGQEVTITANDQTVATLRTHSDGRVYFFPRAYPIQADEYQVEVAGQSFTIPANSSQREWFVTVENSGDGGNAVNLDVLFLIDATGSMSDEINQLKENIRAISAQIDALPSQPNVRFGMVTYRDRGDAYLTDVTDFTPNVDEFAADLAQVYADGGGDYPEDLNQALSEAIHQPEWRVTNTVSLIFLVADAPPHLDYGQQNHYAAEMFQAAQRGIKIYPIASSGLDSQGEYIFRQLAQATGGRFIFLTYGAEGPGSTGTETEFNVSDYTVSSLDALVVKIVEEELAYLQ
ncbi:MAG: VWA domain-containing protein [Ardenticatenaceae bacterium]|nr:VWA domain-containing protein [Ardenticatenaceae bacterium]MCB9443123.1 VWA domain-containing protein [Ardenticatenaceae bacterium]